MVFWLPSLRTVRKGATGLPRVSKRQRKGTVQKTPKIKYYRTAIYIRLSRKDGGHGRKDSIYIQKQICTDFVKKHPEMLLTKVYIDNGVTGTTFERDAFEELMDDVRAGRIDCIVVKDFSRFGRDALDAVDLIDIIFPSLDVRFISILDEYDSENLSCVEDRVSNILKHFMNDYYAREISVKLVQAHKQSREKGEFWGARPPYGYKRSPESSKIIIPDEEEKKIVQKIFFWYVFEDMSSYDIAKELNAQGVWSPQESYELREYGKRRRKDKILWRMNAIRTILQNPVYIGAAVYGKTKQMLAENVPLHLIPRNQWEIKENVWEPLIEKSIFDKAIEIGKERWREVLQIWAVNDKREHAANGPLRGKVYCANCMKRMQRRMAGPNKYQYYFYSCPSTQYSDHICSLKHVNEKYVFTAIEAALKRQIQLAVEFQKKYGEDFYKNLKAECELSINKAKEKYESYHVKMQRLFEHYATGIIDKEEYIEIKKDYTEEQERARETLEEVQKRSEELLDAQKAKIDWGEELIKHQNFTTITKEIADRFIERVIIKSYQEITVIFWFGDIFLSELLEEEGGLSYAI